MKKLTIFLITIPLFFANDLKAQTKRTYFVFVYAQQPINAACNSKVLITQKEEKLAPAEKAAYEKQLRKTISAEYNSKNGYKNSVVTIASPGTFLICYEGVKEVNSWKCSSSFYGTIVGKDASSAMAAYNLYIGKRPEIKYTIIKQWSGEEK